MDVILMENIEQDQVILDKNNLQGSLLNLRKSLLDISLRNNLINFKDRRDTINIFKEDIGQIFKILTIDEKDMSFKSSKEGENIETQEQKWTRPTETTVETKNNVLQTKFEKNELQSRLTRLYRRCRTNIEEQGYNNLFLALGFLKWKESDNDSTYRYAPLILVPVILYQKSLSKPFKITYEGEDVRLNLSLKNKLLEQSIELPINDEEFESPEDIYDYFEQVEDAIKPKKDWEIIDNICLENFSFKKFVMYQDLDLKNWSDTITQKALKDLFDPDVTDNQAANYEEKDIDTLLHVDEIYHVLDADSSQILVIEEAKSGHNLVVEGPPGTGKSQTIVNLIAELMANDKTILFVSEKKAALEVVRSRLDSLGLADGCLELHSNKANKKEVLHNIDIILNKDKTKFHSQNEFEELENVRNSLNEYMNDIYALYANTSLSTYKLYGLWELNQQKLEKQNQEIYNFPMGDLSNCTDNEITSNINHIREVMEIYEYISPLKDNFWTNTNPGEMNIADSDDLIRIIPENNNLIIDCMNASKKLSNLVGSKLFTNLNDIMMNLHKFNSLEKNIKLIKNAETIEKLNDTIIEFNENKQEVNLDIFNTLDLKSLLDEAIAIENKISQLNIKEELALDSYKNDMYNFRRLYDTIRSSGLKDSLKDKHLKNKLNIFINGKKSFFNKILSSEFKSARDSLRSYHPDFNASDDQIINDFTELINCNEELKTIRFKISNCCKFDISDTRLINEYVQLSQAYERLREINNQISEYNFDNDVSLNSHNLKIKLRRLNNLKEKYDFIKENEYLGKQYFEGDWKGLDTDFDKVNSQLKIMEEFTEYYNEGLFTDKTIKYLTDNDDLSTLKEYIDDVQNAYTDLSNNMSYLNDLLNFRVLSELSNYVTLNFDRLYELNNQLNTNLSSFNDYRLYNNKINEYTNDATRELFKLINEDKITKEIAEPLFLYNLADNCLKDILTNHPDLYNFNTLLHNNKVDRFKKLESDILKANKYRVIEKLAQRVPEVSSTVNPNTELGILLHEISKKRKIHPLRQILKECKNVIQDIKPCFMMSPMSIAQYLDPKYYEDSFDYVIFDEASQVKVEDGLGALMRAKNAIIMGDSKQLPPTTFFENDIELNDEEEVFTEMESILNLCKNVYPNKILKWHYRSRHESLIAVSNEEFYDNKLYIYPSPKKNSDQLGLKLEYHPDTIYERGTSGKNPKEAEYVIDYAMEHFSKYPNKSLGIGTFSIKQQQAIYDTLEEKIKEHPELEKYFSTEGEDGFFIKNLENIQGDERDVILVSVGYGFTAEPEHKIYNNFGPLNRDGGYRRLNVLMTRSREKCVIFSNFKSGELPTDESTPYGLKSLKTFLYYAEHKEFPANYSLDNTEYSPFEESVYNFLTDEGYIVEKQVGCAGYKIDLAIVDPDDEDRYLLAIECDGAPYHSSHVARDRERLRQRQLESLGWTFYRIWSADWYNNRKNAKRTLLNKIKTIMEHKDDEIISEKILEPEPEENYEPNVEIIKKEPVKESSNEEYSEFDYEIQTKSLYDTDVTFTEELLKNMIEQESPIHILEIYDRTKKIFNNQKSTQKFKNTLNSILDKLVNENLIFDENDFYYSKDTFENRELIKARKRNKPQIDRISEEEIKDGIQQVSQSNHYLSEENLAKEVSKILGFRQLQKKTKTRLLEVIHQIQEENTNEEE